MGWNDLKLKRPDHPVLTATQPGDHAYFVHSYHFVAERPQDVMAEVEYGGAVAAMIGRDNLVGVQFHPEKSQQVGLKLLGAFLAWRP
jgi:glutamine amidotransferase